MATVAQIMHLAEIREGHLALLRAHSEQPDGSCACGDRERPCIWELGAILGIAECERRAAEIEAEVDQTAAGSPMALTQLLASA